jgi:hypothetical protein
MLTALERLSDGCRRRLTTGGRDREEGGNEARPGRGSRIEEHSGRLVELRDRLKLSVSEKMPEGETPVAELVERIRVLRDP